VLRDFAAAPWDDVLDGELAAILLALNEPPRDPDPGRRSGRGAVVGVRG
jgi:hypothetical protein